MRFWPILLPRCWLLFCLALMGWQVSSSPSSSCCPEYWKIICNEWYISHGIASWYNSKWWPSRIWGYQYFIQRACLFSPPAHITTVWFWLRIFSCFFLQFYHAFGYQLLLQFFFSFIAAVKNSDGNRLFPASMLSPSLTNISHRWFFFWFRFFEIIIHFFVDHNLPTI